MMRPKILQTCLSKSWGGLEMVALETSKNLQLNGFQVTTLAIEGSELFRQLKSQNQATLGVHSRFKFAMSRFLTFRRYLRLEKPHIVLVQHLSDLWLVVPGLIGFSGIRVVGLSHTFLGVSKKDWGHSFLYKRLARLIALTPKHRENLLANLPLQSSQVRVIPNAVDLQKFNPIFRDEKIKQNLGASEETILIGVVSRLDRGKGLGEALQAAERLKDQGLPFRLVFIGQETKNEPGMRSWLLGQIHLKKLDECVALVGHFQELAPVMASLDLLLMPAPKETFGRVILEAMAAGVPVVACRGGGVSDIIRSGKDGLLVESGQGQEMSRALRHLILNPLQRRLLRKNALDSVRRFYEKNQILDEFSQLLRETLEPATAMEIPKPAKSKSA